MGGFCRGCVGSLGSVIQIGGCCVSLGSVIQVGKSIRVCGNDSFCSRIGGVSGLVCLFQWNLLKNYWVV